MSSSNQTLTTNAREEAGISWLNPKYHNPKQIRKSRLFCLSHQKIKAIKLYKERYGTNLTESKAAVEEMEKGLAAQKSDQTQQPRRSEERAAKACRATTTTEVG